MSIVSDILELSSFIEADPLAFANARIYDPPKICVRCNRRKTNGEYHCGICERILKNREFLHITQTFRGWE